MAMPFCLPSSAALFKRKLTKKKPPQCIQNTASKGWKTALRFLLSCCGKESHEDLSLSESGAERVCDPFEGELCTESSGEGRGTRKSLPVRERRLPLDKIWEIFPFMFVSMREGWYQTRRVWNPSNVSQNSLKLWFYTHFCFPYTL